MDRPTLQVRSDGSEPGRLQLTSSRSIPLNSTQELHETRLELDARVERLSYAIETLRDEMASIDQVHPGRVGNESDNDDSDEGREAQSALVQSPADADSSSAESLAAVGDGRLTLSPLSLESSTTTAPSSIIEPPFRTSSPAPLEYTAGQYFVRPNFSPLRPSLSNPPPGLDRLDTDGDRAARSEEVSTLRRSTPQRRTLPSLESTSYAPLPFDHSNGLSSSISNRFPSSSSGLAPSDSSNALHVSESSSSAYIFPASITPRRSLQRARSAIPVSANNDLPSPPAATTAHLISDTRLIMRERVEHLRAAFLSRGEHLRGAFPLTPPTVHTTAALDSNIASLPAPPRPSLPPSPSPPSPAGADSPEQDRRPPRPPVRSRTLRPPAMLPMLSRGPPSPSSTADPNADMFSSFSSLSQLSAHRQPSYLSSGDDGGLHTAAAAAALSAHDNPSRRTQQQQQQDTLRYRGPSLRHQQPQQQTAQAQALPMAQARAAGGGGGGSGDSSFWSRDGEEEVPEGIFADSGEVEIWEALRRSRESGMGPVDIDLPSTTSRAFFVSPLQRNSHSQSASPALFDPNGLDYVPPATTPETPPAPTAANNSNGCAPDSLITPLPAWLLPWDNDEEGSGSAWHRFAAAVLFAEGSTEGSSLSEEGEGNRWVVVVSPRGEDDEERSIPGEGGEREGGRFRRPGPVELPAFLWTQSALSQDVGVKRVRWRERVCTSISWVEVEGPKEELEIGR